MPIKHPDYPDIDFKPAIARYDFDQTYDVLEFVYLPQGFDQLIDLCGIPAFEVMAIDRFTPYRYRWAEEYSQSVYDFLKRFNFSPHNAINERLLRDEAGNLIKDENDNTITVPAFEYDAVNFNDFTIEINNTFPSGTYRITALIYQGYQEGLIGSLPTINQAFITLTFEEDTTFNINQVLFNWLNEGSILCACSMVFEKQNDDGSWQEYTPSISNKPEWLLYSDVTTYFNKIEQQLVDYFQTIYDDFKKYLFYEKQAPTNVYGGQGFPYSRCYVALTIIPLQNYLKEINRTGSFTSFTRNFQLSPYDCIVDKIPSYLLDLCYLAIANNNKWSTGVNYNDLGTVKNIRRFSSGVSSDYFSFSKFNQSFDNNLPSEMINHRMLLGVNESVTYPFFDAWSIGGEHTNPLGNNNKFSIQLASYYYPSAASGNYSTDAIFAQSPKNYFPSYCKEILNNYIGTIGLPKVLPDGRVEFNKKLRLVKGSFIRGGEYDPDFDHYSTFTITDHDSPYTVSNEMIKIEIKLLTQQEIINNISINTMSDQEYLDYLLQLKAQYEEESKTW